MRFDPETDPVCSPTGYRPTTTFETADNRSDQVQLYEFCCYANDFIHAAETADDCGERAAYLKGLLDYLTERGKAMFS